jgi:chemotaxis protein histidine kinase CheA
MNCVAEGSTASPVPNTQKNFFEVKEFINKFNSMLVSLQNAEKQRKEIAKELFITVHTVKAHVAILSKSFLPRTVPTLPLRL